MTKQDLQKELKEKVKPGVKPSNLRKLKRSKSADNIPSSPAQSIPLTKSKSSEPIPSFSDPKYPYTTLISQQQEIDQLKKASQAKSDTIKLLRTKIDKLEAKDTPPSPLLAQQLKEKQQEIETLRKNLEEVNQQLSNTTQELDNSLIARYESNQQFRKVYDKWQAVKLELIQTEDDTTEDIISQDKEISQLRGQRQQFKLKVQELERDLNLTQRLAELRKVPLPSDYPTDFDYLKYVLYSCLAVWFVLVLVRNWPERE